MTRHDVTYPPAPRQDALFRAIFERSAIGICLRDQEGRFVETNPALYHAKANGKACAVLFASTEHDYDTMPTRRGEP